MKILIFSSYRDAWNSVRPEAEMFIEMAKLGHEVTIMTQGDAEYVPRFRDNGVTIIDCYPKKRFVSTRSRRYVTRCIKNAMTWCTP